MKMNLLVDSNEFWAALKKDIQAAQERILIQTFSFEGDSVGKLLAEALLLSSAPDKRILVDDYTTWVISDKYLYLPANLFDAQLRHEVRETYRMIEALKQNGVRVQFTQPTSLLGKLAMHNHKKVILIDRHIAYIGGINFSEHNFAWHDSMLRFEDAAVAEVLYADFQSTWEGENPELSHHSGDIELHCLGGASNHVLFDRILAMIDDARDRIFVESPYITFPFLDRLGKAARRGCAVTLVTPMPNNQPIVREYILWASTRAGIDVQLYPRMTHLKAMLIDGRYLIVGSSNYDFLSYQFHQEIVAIITNPELISEYTARVFQQDIGKSQPVQRIGNIKGWLINAGMRLSAKMVSLFVHPPIKARRVTLNTPSPASEI